MTAMTLVARGSVQTWECDVMGHMNVQFYVAYASEGLAALTVLLGYGGRQLRDRRQAWIVRDQHMRFLRELRPGTPFSIHAGVLEADAHRLRVYQEIRHSADGTVSAALTSALELADLDNPQTLRSIPRLVLDRAQAMRLDLPAQGMPRGLTLSGPLRERATLGEADRLGMLTTAMGAVQANHCDGQGHLRLQSYIGRIAEAVPNLFAEGRSRQPGPEGRRGGAALEYRLLYRTRPREGDTLMLKSGLKAVGEKTINWVHWLFDLESDTLVCTAEAVGIALDLVTRKAMAMPDDERAALQALVIPGLGP